MCNSQNRTHKLLVARLLIPVFLTCVFITGCKQTAISPTTPSNVSVKKTLVNGKLEPIWTIPTHDLTQIHTVSDTLFLSEKEDITILNRADGKQLWNLVGYEKDSQTDGMQHLDSRKYKWVGVTFAGRHPQIFVGIQFDRHSVDVMKTLERTSDTLNVELFGLDSHTGKEIWRSSMEIVSPQVSQRNLRWNPLGVYGDVIVLHDTLDPMNETIIPKNLKTDIRFLDARTGRTLNLSFPDDETLLKDAATLYNTPFIWLPNNLLLNLEPKKRPYISLTSFNLDGFGEMVSSVNNKLVFSVSGDDGMTGHSLWPNFVICTTPQGKKIWQFPKIIPDKYDFETLRKHYDQVQGCGMHPQFDVAFIATNKFTYVVNPKNGETIRKFAVSLVWKWIRYGNGYLEYDSSVGKLNYLDGSNGKPLKSIAIGKLEEGSNIYLSREDFLGVVSNGTTHQLSYFSGDIFRDTVVVKEHK